MALSYQDYTGNGVQKQFTITFGYLDRSHVKVKVNGADVSFSFVNANVVECDDAPGDGTLVRVQRDTPINSRVVDWVNGSNIVESDLDAADLQMLYIAQETRDFANSEALQAATAAAAQAQTYATAAANSADSAADSANDAAQSAADAAAAAGSLVIPPGVIWAYAGATAPAGWLLAAGQAVSRTTYAALFSAIGTTYGVGDGSTTFNLPDLRGRVPVGKDNMNESDAGRVTTAGSGLDGDALGAVGGSETHKLTSAESGVAPHSHTASTNTSGAHTHTGATDTQGAHQHTYQKEQQLAGEDSALAGTGMAGPALTSSAGAHAHNVTINSGGAHSHAVTVNNAGAASAANAHNNVQPSIVLNYIIKT